jgi:3D (Asp-Asp-Asp) domain-containing protein
MKKSTLLGSVISVLLAFSVISYARTYVQPQDPKPVPQKNQTVNTQSTTPAEAARPEASATLVEPVNADSKNAAPEALTRTVALPGEIYSATAYSLRGRTASGKPVTRGVIAADPRVLPIGTRVRVEAGAWSGEYVVADTGGAVRGRRIDIWTPSSGEAMRFGRRAVKLTILEVGGKRARTASVRPRLVNSVNVSPSTEAAASKQ